MLAMSLSMPSGDAFKISSSAECLSDDRKQCVSATTVRCRWPPSRAASSPSTLGVLGEALSSERGGARARQGRRDDGVSGDGAGGIGGGRGGGGGGEGGGAGPSLGVAKRSHGAALRRNCCRRGLRFNARLRCGSCYRLCLSRRLALGGFHRSGWRVVWVAGRLVSPNRGCPWQAAVDRSGLGGGRRRRRRHDTARRP